MAIERLTPSRRRELTRRNLLEAAAVVFSREGFHGASLDEVAAAAGFTKGAVYSNFKSKEDLFLALLEDRVAEGLAVAEAARQADAALPPDARDDDPLANIRDVMSYPRWWDRNWTLLYLAFVLYAARNPAAQAKLAESLRRSHDEAARMIEKELERSGVTSQLPLDEMATVSVAVFEGLSMIKFVEPALVTSQTVDAALTFLMAAERALEVDSEAGAPPRDPESGVRS